MNIAITGSSGFIGSHIVRRLKDNHTLTLFDAKRQSLDDIYTLESFVKDQDVIIHLAAVINETKKNIYKVNILGTQNLLMAIKKYSKKNAKVIFTSSFAVYKPTTTKTPLTENSLEQPRNDYGVSKLKAEELIKQYTQNSIIQSVILRLSNGYGPDAKPEYSVINKFVTNIINSVPIVINGDGLQTRDFIYIDDVIKAIELSIWYNKTDYLLCNICTGNETTLIDLIRLVEQISQKEAIVHYNQEMYDVGYWIGDGSLAREKLQFKSITNLEVGLTKTVEWYRKNK